jgi:hypothetical protein
MREIATPVKVDELSMLDRRQELEEAHGVQFEFHQRGSMDEPAYPLLWTASWPEKVGRPAGGIGEPTPMTELVPQVEEKLRRKV